MAFLDILLGGRRLQLYKLPLNITDNIYTKTEMKSSVWWNVTLVILGVFALVDTSFSFERFDIVTTAEMQELLDNRKKGTIDFILVNSLDRIIYREHSIPESINIPLSEIGTHLSLLGTDKDKLIITYCMGFR